VTDRFVQVSELEEKVRAKLVICQSLDGTDGYEFEVRDLRVP